MMMIEDFLYNKKIYYYFKLSFIYLEKTSLENTINSSHYKPIPEKIRQCK